MQKIMNMITKEGYEGGNGSLDFSCVCIELTLAPDTIYEGSFQVFGSKEDPTYGYIISTDSRMECITGELSGNQDIISYRFCADDLEVGTCVEGEFCVISNHGEYALPFRVQIEQPLLTSSLGDIRNLNQFANLARENWAEAVRLFYTSEFYSVLRGNDRRYYDLYRGMSQSLGNQQNVEEFLTACAKKQPIQYSVFQEKLKAAGESSDITELSLTIRKEGWGYTGLTISVEGQFVFTEKEILTDDDFLGNQCVLPVYIDNSLLRRGRNFGAVCLCNARLQIRVPIEISSLSYHSVTAGTRLESEKLLVELMDYYQQHRLGQISATAWMSQTGRIVERLVSMNEQDVAARLFQAQYFIAQGRQHEASWLLTHSLEIMEHDGKRNPDLIAYYLFLTTRINQDKEYFRQVVDQIEELSRKNKTSWRIAWLVLNIIPGYRSHPTQKWELLEKQFRYGCTSPIWYMEALLTLNENPMLLRRLEEYELQVLFYGARKEAVSAELMEQFLYLAGRKREFSSVLLRLMIRLYESRADERLLQEICAQLIKGGKTDEEAFYWYEKGIESELRLTRLYEYYMMSMDLSREHVIARKALLYFAWQTNLDYEHAAYLYCYIVRNRELLGEIWEQYKDRIEHFVVDQILKRHMNACLAYLYQELLTPAMLSGQLAEALSELLFTYRIATKTSGITKAVVISADMENIREYPVLNGSTYVVLYGEKDTVLLEDGKRNRYICAVTDQKVKMLDPLPLLDMISLYIVPGHVAPEFDRCLWEMGRKKKELSQDTVERGKYLLQHPEVSDYIKCKIQMRLLTHYQSKQDMKGLDACLMQVNWEALDEEARFAVIRELVLRNKWDNAYTAVSRYGVSGIEPDVLLKLCDWKIEQTGLQEEQVLTNMAVQAFIQHRYSSTTLQYLIKFGRGRVQELDAVRKASLGYGIDCSELCGRLLVQMLFSGVKSSDFPEILRYYFVKGADLQIKKAAISGCSYAYLIKNREQESVLFQEMERLCAAGEELNSIDKLAYLKYCAQEGLKDPYSVTLSRVILEDMLKQGIRLNFFKKLSGCDDLLEPLMDKTIIECRENPGTRVVVHYSIGTKDTKSKSFRKEEMAMAPGGIYYKEFILFFGETLEYYITKESDRQTQVSQLMSISREEGNVPERGRYMAINEILKCRSMDAFESLDRQLEEYYHKEYLGSRLFTLR